MDHALRTIVKPEIQNILDHFCKSFNIRTLLYAPDGQIIKAGKDMPDSDFCLLIRRLYGVQTCLTLDEKMREIADKKQKSVCYKCHAGLNECIEPLFAGDMLIGYAMIGQFRSDDLISETMLDDWEKKFGPCIELKNAFFKLSRYEDDKRDHIIAMFRVLAEYILSKELIGVEGSLFVQRIQNYLIDNVYKIFSLSDVARIFEVCDSTISHALKKYSGKTFKQLYSELKIKEAKKLIRQDPLISIGAVADKLGYNDQFYFSRVFRKVTGVSPSDYKKEINSVRR